MSRQGNSANEDYAFACEQFAFVIDGSSGLTSKKYTDRESDAQWFSHSLGILLQTRLHDIGKPIKDIVSEITNELCTQFKRFLAGAEYDLLDMPSACLSVLRAKGDKIEFFQLGDCVTIILKTNGEIDVFLDDSVLKLDNAVVSNVLKISREKSIPYADALIYGKEQLIHNRKKLNTPGGYEILELIGAGIEHAYTSNFSGYNIKAVSILSDGFAEIVDLYELYDYKTLMNKMETCDLNLLCDELFAAQNKDYTMGKYPRLKHRDDSSAVWCGINPLAYNKNTGIRT